MTTAQKFMTNFIDTRKFVFFNALLLTVLFFLTGSYRSWPYKIESDGKYYYQYLVSVWFDGDLDLANNYQHPQPDFMLLPIDHYDFKSRINSLTNQPINVFPIGSAILWSPFFAVLYGAGWLSNQIIGTNFTLDGWGQAFQYGVMYSSAVIYAILTWLMMADLLRSYFTRWGRLVAILGIFWATNWSYYTIFEVSMSHTYDLFTLVLFVWVWQKFATKLTPQSMTILAITGGLHVLVRPQNLLTAVIILGYQNWLWWQAKTVSVNSIRQHLNQSIWLNFVFGLIFTLMLTPMFYINYYLHGHPLTLPQGSGFLSWGQPNFYGLLLSERNGLFSHHPVLWLGVFGLLIPLYQFRSQPKLIWRLVVPLCLVFGAQIYINAIVGDWWAGHSFGQRRLVSSLFLFVIGTAYLFDAAQKNFSGAFQRIVPAAIIFFVTINVYVTLIHVFLWDYDEPHNIWHWMYRTLFLVF